jgi:hypothetical protein
MYPGILLVPPGIRGAGQEMEEERNSWPYADSRRGGAPADLQLGHSFSADLSSQRMAKPDLEQTAPQTPLAASRTYSSSKSTNTSVRELAAYPKAGGRDTPSRSRTTTPGGLKLC